MLNNILKQCPLSLPELSSASSPGQPTRIEKNTEQTRANQDLSQISKKNNKKSSKALKNSNTQGNGTTQLTIIETWKKAGAISSDVATESSTGVCSKISQTEATACPTTNSNESVDTDIEISETAKLLEAQRYRFRPLLVDCFTILSYPKVNYLFPFNDLNICSIFFDYCVKYMAK